MSRNKVSKFFNLVLSFLILIPVCLPLGQGFRLFSFAQEEFAYDTKGKRDPFIPLVTSDGRLLKLDKEEAKGDLLLEGIIYDKQGRSYAIVNSAVVGIGDFIGAYQVLKIEQNKVIFIKEGETTEVILKKEE
jgi:hypothetical protein